MGNYLASGMEEKMKKNQEAMQEMQRINMERQREFQREMQRTQVAMQVAGSREFFVWLSTFYVMAAAGLLRGYRQSKRPYLLAPLVPLTFVTLYYADLAHGSKLHRIRTEAEHIMTHETDLLRLPLGPPAPSVDLGAIEGKENTNEH